MAKKRLEEESDRLREEAAMKRQSLAIGDPPNQVSVSVDDTTLNSSLTHSGSSSKKLRSTRSPELVVLMGDSDEDDGNTEDELPKVTDSHLLAQSAYESPIPPPAPINRKKPVCPVEEQLNPTSLAVLEQYRTKHSAKENNGYGMDYPY